MTKTFLVNAGSLSASRTFLALSQVFALPIVSRFLVPSEFGDMAIAMSIVIFGQMLSDAGMGRSLIRQPDYDAAEWNSVFWLLTGVGGGLSLILVALAPVWVMLFDRPPLLGLVSALAVLPLLNALAAVAIARMEKDGRFPQLALIRIVAGVIGMVTVLVLAVAGAGVWSLVIQQIVIAAIQTAGAFLYSNFCPSLPRNFTPLRGHIRFASDNVGVSLIFSVQRQGPVLLIGAILGAVPLGLFSMAQRFLTLPRNAVSGPVAQVVFLRMTKVQDEGHKVADIYVASCLLLAVAVFPPMAVLAGSAGSLFPFFLSGTWSPAAMIFALAAPGMMIEVATGSAGVMLQALDRTRLRLWMVTERTVLRTAAVAVAVPFGIEATALVLSLFSIAYLPRYVGLAQRVVPVSQLALLHAMSIASIASALAWVAMSYCGQIFSGWKMLGLACAALPLTWALAILPQIPRLRWAVSLLNG